MQFGLLGKKLGHSYSPQIHSHLGDYPYDLFEKSPEELDDFLKNGDFDGLNVTIPYKKTVIPYCASLSPIAMRLGAINTLIRRNDGQLVGHNTDYFGFKTMLRKSGVPVKDRLVVVLGAGGASNTVVAVLEEMGAIIHVIAHKDNNPETLSRYSDAIMLVNATPVGMYPNNGETPVDLSYFPKLEGVLDLIYNPARTQLMLDAEARGIITVNGLEMLVAQAKESAEWFIHRAIPSGEIDRIFVEMRNQMENIILIGMPGSGKSTIGTMLAEATGRQFVDADAYLVEKAGRPIADIFANDGEAAFRQLETEVLQELGKRSGLVIATGGGCVTRPENYPLLHQNGTIFRLCRDLDKLPTDGRPLMKTTAKIDMFRVRDPLYKQFADHEIDNNSTPEATVARILHILEE